MIRKIPIAPDPEDFAAVDAEYGPLPHDASEKQATDRYRLAQASKRIRTNSPAILGCAINLKDLIKAPLHDWS
jgi:hypothetical protein